MSIPVFSCVSGEAEKLKSNGIEISVGEDLDGNKRVNITRDDGNQVKFNNLYNTTEIDERILGQYFDLKGFPWITTNEDGTLPVLNTDGTLDELSAQTFLELYEIIKSNIENIKQYFQSVDSNAFDANLNINEIRNKLNKLDSDYKLSKENLSILYYFLNDSLNNQSRVHCIETNPEKKKISGDKHPNSTPDDKEEEEDDDDYDFVFRVPKSLNDKLYINTMSYVQEVPKPSPTPPADPDTSITVPPVPTPPELPTPAPPDIPINKSSKYIIPYKSENTPGPLPTPIPNPDMWITSIPPTENEPAKIKDNTTEEEYYPVKTEKHNNVDNNEFLTMDIDSVIRYLTRSVNNTAKVVANQHNNFSKYVSQAFLFGTLGILGYDQIRFNNRLEEQDGRIVANAIPRTEYVDDMATIEQLTNTAFHNIDVVRQHLFRLEQQVRAINSCTCDKHKLEDLVNDFNVLKQKVDTFKSCNCDGNQIGSIEFLHKSIADLQNRIFQLYRQIDRTKIDTENFQESAFEYIQNNDKKEISTQMIQNINLIPSNFVEVETFPSALEAISTNTTGLYSLINQSVQTLTDRTWMGTNSHVYDINLERWIRTGYSGFPDNWRFDASFNAPGEFIRDINRNEWVRIGGNHDSSWRRNRHSFEAEQLGSRLRRGKLEFIDGEWVYDSTPDGGTDPNLLNREWNAPEDYIWHLTERRWVQLEGYEGYSVFNTPNWRNTRILDQSIPSNFVFDVNYDEWVLIDGSPEMFPDGWRTNRSSIVHQSLNLDIRIHGLISWSEFVDGGMWIWNTMDSFRRNWENPPPHNVWNLNLLQWVLIDNYAPSIYIEGWRNNPNWDAPDEYVWDIENNEWVATVNYTLDAVFHGWRTDENDSTKYVFITNDSYKKSGELIWDGHQWVWKPKSNQMTPASINLLSEEDTVLALPGSDLQS